MATKQELQTAKPIVFYTKIEEPERFPQRDYFKRETEKVKKSLKVKPKINLSFNSFTFQQNSFCAENSILENIYNYDIKVNYTCRSQMVCREFHSLQPISSSYLIEDVINFCKNNRQNEYIITGEKALISNVIFVPSDVIQPVPLGAKGQITVEFTVEPMSIAEYPISEELPKIPPKDYKIFPNMYDLLRMTTDQLVSVEGFSISNSLGKISFLFPVNLIGCDLREGFIIGHNYVSILPDTLSQLTNMRRESTQTIRVEFFSFPFENKKDYETFLKKTVKRQNFLVEKVYPEKSYLSLVANTNSIKFDNL